jgi:hypothetical protein
METADERFLQVAQALSAANENELAELAYSALETSDPQIGLFAGSKLDRIRAWVSGKLVGVSQQAGNAGVEVLRILGEDRTRGDLHLAAILAVHLSKVLGMESLHVEEIVALSLLVVRLYEPPSTGK